MIKNETLDILIIDHSSINVDLILDIYSQQHISAQLELTQSIPELLEKLEEQPWLQIILIIDSIPVSVDALREAMPDINKECPVIVMMEDYDRKSALQYIHSGATDVFSLNEIDALAKLTKKIASNTISENKMQTELDSLKHSHERCITLNKQIPLPIAFIHEGVFITTNPAFNTFFGINSNEEIAEISFLDVIAPQDVGKIKAKLREISSNAQQHTSINAIEVNKSADCQCSVNLLISPTIINHEPGLQVIFQPDEPAQPNIQHKKNTHFLAPEAFIQTLHKNIQNNNKKQAYSVSFFELDNYSRIKKNIGITRSDHLLHEISDFMSQQASTTLTISQLNLDVYTLLVSADNTEDCIKKISHLQAAFAQYSFSSILKNIRVSSNIGVVHITDYLQSPEQALSLADVACTVSRNNKLNKPHVYNQKNDRSTVENTDQNWADKIQDALKFDNFKLLFQPIVSLGSEHEAYYEVLLRIKSSSSQDRLPKEFLHFAKESKLESDIDKWVIKNAVTMLEENNKEPIRFFINLSASSVKNISFIDWLTTQYGAQIMHLVFEIPEDIAVQWQSETLHFIQQIKKHDGSICIDRFSNQAKGKSQINALNADFHKIDGGFVGNLSTNRKHQAIIRTICLDSRASDTKLIATYVQDADTLAILWREGVDFIQGNYLQVPASHLDYKFEGQI